MLLLSYFVNMVNFTNWFSKIQPILSLRYDVFFLLYITEFACKNILLKFCVYFKKLYYSVIFFLHLVGYIFFSCAKILQADLFPVQMSSLDSMPEIDPIFTYVSTTAKGMDDFLKSLT